MKKILSIMTATVLLLLPACNKNTEQNTQNLSQKELSTVEQSEVVFIGNEFSFQPNAVTLKAGKTVKIIFKNQGTAIHDLAIERYKEKTKQIGQNEEDSFLFTPDKPGTYAIYCSVAGHRDFGMEGTITVE